MSVVPLRRTRRWQDLDAEVAKKVAEYRQQRAIEDRLREQRARRRMALVEAAIWFAIIAMLLAMSLER